MTEEKTYTATEVKAMVAEIMANQNDTNQKARVKMEQLEKTIGPLGSWLRCFSCGMLSDKPRYKDVEEDKATLEYHSSDIWREMYNNGKYFCPSCHKAIHMREGKEIKKRIKAGEMDDPTLKANTEDVPVMGGMTRSAGGSVKERS